MFDDIQIVKVEDGDANSSDMVGRGTVKVTLQRGNELVSCDGILIFDPDEVDDGIFEEWVELALDGEEGYEHWLA